jgi:hypothetical protein
VRSATSRISASSSSCQEQQRDETAAFGHRHVDERSRAYRLEARGAGCGAGILSRIGDDHGAPRLQIVDIAAIVSEMEQSRDACDARRVPVALDPDGLGLLVDRAIARPAHTQPLAQHRRRGIGDCVRLLQVADTVSELGERFVPQTPDPGVVHRKPCHTFDNPSADKRIQARRHKANVLAAVRQFAPVEGENVLENALNLCSKPRIRGARPWKRGVGR